MRLGREWTEADLQALVDTRARETTELDFKVSGALNKQNAGRNGLAKDVASMANANGGSLVYGIVEDGIVAIGVDVGVDPADITKEWIDQIISSTISPRVQGYAIRQIPLEIRAPGRVAYAIEIPKALSFGPHQTTADGKYHIRRNTTTMAMEDYEIREHMRRSDTPEPYLSLSLSALPEENTFSLGLQVGNRSSEPSLYTNVRLILQATMASTRPDGNHWQGPTVGRLDAGEDVQVWAANLMVPHHMPLFRESLFSFGQTRLTIPPHTRHRLGYEIRCPGHSTTNYGTIVRLDDEARLTDFLLPIT